MGNFGQPIDLLPTKIPPCQLADDSESLTSTCWRPAGLKLKPKFFFTDGEHVSAEIRRPLPQSEALAVD